LLRQHRTTRHIKQNAAHLKALVLLRIQTGGFGVNDQQSGRGGLWRVLWLISLGLGLDGW